MAIAFMGYVLPFGQMSFWGATVITNLLSPFPSLIEWVCGGHYVYNPTLKRFFLFHFQFPFLLCGFRILHLFYLHFLSSNNPLRNSTNNKIRFTSIFTFFFFGEIRNLTTLCVLPLVNNGFSLSSFFLSLLSYLWIGAQFPQEKFLSYGRILTLHYYFLLMCILFSFIFYISTDVINNQRSCRTELTCQGILLP
eukprot:UN1719